MFGGQGQNFKYNDGTGGSFRGSPSYSKTCEKAPNTPYDLGQHKLSQMVDGNTELFSCTAAFVQKNNHQIHEGRDKQEDFTMHMNLLPVGVNCDVCSKAFANNNDLQKHVASHHTHLCAVCNDTFPQISNLVNHMESWHWFRCCRCNEAFTDLGTRNMHHRKCTHIISY
ncbi:zinc finger protein with KRAB and SCAN domains 1-like [Copidosoma floridanum]|uniref:zinc finger protein with KRAB and SCAN domains 1-like n=1 Tax=Copidosoma floridanum TaxID=29053 RepID=UPI0006C96A7A|nr:zinc finger protein with KRAB and SCAN domains 1-like [Copidosoma floridanum]